MNLIDLWKIVRQSFHLFHVISTLLCDGKLCCPWKNCVTWSKEKKLIQTCALHSSQLSVAFRAPCERSCVCESASEMTWKYIACQYDIATDHNKSWNNNGPSTRLTIIEVSANANVDQRTNHCDSNTIARDFAFCSVCNEIDNEFEETLHATATATRHKRQNSSETATATVKWLRLPIIFRWKFSTKNQRSTTFFHYFILFDVLYSLPFSGFGIVFYICSWNKSIVQCPRERAFALKMAFLPTDLLKRCCRNRRRRRQRFIVLHDSVFCCSFLRLFQFQRIYLWFFLSTVYLFGDAHFMFETSFSSPNRFNAIFTFCIFLILQLLVLLFVGWDIIDFIFILFSILLLLLLLPFECICNS